MSKRGRFALSIETGRSKLLSVLMPSFFSAFDGCWCNSVIFALKFVGAEIVSKSYRLQCLYFNFDHSMSVNEAIFQFFFFL